MCVAVWDSLILCACMFFIRMCASIHPVLFIVVIRSCLYLSLSGLKHTHTHTILEIALYSTSVYGFQSYKLWYRTGERTGEIFQRLKLTAVVLQGSHYSTAIWLKHFHTGFNDFSSQRADWELLVFKWWKRKYVKANFPLWTRLLVVYVACVPTLTQER